MTVFLIQTSILTHVWHFQTRCKIRIIYCSSKLLLLNQLQNTIVDVFKAPPFEHRCHTIESLLKQPSRHWSRFFLEINYSVLHRKTKKFQTRIGHKRSRFDRHTRRQT